MNLIGLLLTLLIVCVVVWAARALMAAFNLGEPISTVVYVIIVLICLFWLLGQFGVLGNVRLR